LVLPKGKITVSYTVDNRGRGRYYDGHWLVGGEPDEKWDHKLIILDGEDVAALQRHLAKAEPKDGFLFVIEHMLGTSEGGVSLPEPVGLDLL
jgi:hypothetical protein